MTSADQSTLVAVTGRGGGDDLRRRCVLALAQSGLRADVSDAEAEAILHADVYQRGGPAALAEVLTDGSGPSLAALRADRQLRLAHGAAETEALIELERLIRHQELMEKWPPVGVSSF